MHDISAIPDDNPSKPSIKFIAFVIPTIHITVTIIDISFANSMFCTNGISAGLICIPNATAIIAAKTCPNSFCNGFNVLVSSITPVIVIIITPIPTPINFLKYRFSSKRFILPSMFITEIKYINDIAKPVITASPPNFGIDFFLILLSSFGISIAPIFSAIFIEYGVTINDTINANRNDIAIFPHIAFSSYFIFSFSILFIISILS